MTSIKETHEIYVYSRTQNWHAKELPQDL